MELHALTGIVIILYLGIFYQLLQISTMEPKHQETQNKIEQKKEQSITEPQNKIQQPQSQPQKSQPLQQPSLQSQSQAQSEPQMPSYMRQKSQELSSKIQALITQIRAIQDEQIEAELSNTLTEQLQSTNTTSIKTIIAELLPLQNSVHLITNLLNENPNIQEEEFNQKYDKESKTYETNENEIDGRYEQLMQNPDDSNWTDATQSQAEDDEIYMVDEQIMQAMQQEQQIEQEGSKEENGEVKEKEQINIEQLQQQFVTGQESDHHILLGKHDKFCVSVNCLPKQLLLCSGGGDDYLYLYNLPSFDSNLNPNQCIHPYHILKHTETVNKIQISYSKEYVFTMTDNQVFCTELKTKETSVLKSKPKKQTTAKTEDKKENKKQGKKNGSNDSQSEEEEEPVCSDMVCHHLGDVVAISSGFEVQIYNIKGLKLYQTYYPQQPVQSLTFTESGKQLVLNCSDNRLRLLTPKTSQFSLVTGVKQHKQQISVIKTKGDIILSGCIDGYIGISSIKKSSMTTLIGIKQHEDVDGAINQIQFAGDYFIAGSIADRVDWYDFGKAKKLFQSPTQGSPSDILWQGKSHQYIYNISTIKGYIHLYDCRNPLKQISKTRAGNTIHKLWADDNIIAGACQDGHVRLYDIRKLL